MKTYRVGLIGFGFIGKVHAYGHINLPMFFDQSQFSTRITHVCTSRQTSADKAAEQLGAVVAVTDYHEITENPDIDIVHICTPNHLHKDALLSAIKNNKHIYCDKPMVVDMKEAEEIKEALKNYTATAQMTLQNRFFPATIRAKQLIAENRLGQILEFRACYLHSGSADPKAPLKWKLSADAGGGVIADLASHVMDLIHFLLGDYESLVAQTKIAYPERPSVVEPGKMVKVEVEDYVQMLVKMKCGATGNIEASKIATGTEDEIRFEIHGSKGALRFNGMDAHHLEFYDTIAVATPNGGTRGWTAIDTGQRYDKPAGFPGPKFAIGWLRGHLQCLYNFLECVHNNKSGNPGLEQGIYIQYLMDKVRESAKDGKWVQI
ncbi:MAG: Gfo/Idh/MocA family oxidoreductase [Victivallaceae bacterium]|nr:Gfo/Idh/MocA family oxidoreductase [Victivallaceae bacterium]